LFVAIFQGCRQGCGSGMIFSDPDPTFKDSDSVSGYCFGSFIRERVAW
jgi:hypothetical protein